MKKNEVAIIDDGINEKFFDLNVKLNIEINDSLEVVQRVNYDHYKKSHGSFCAAIIKKYYNAAVFISIKILDDFLYGTTDKLVRAIEWCIDNDIEVIHLSIGTNNFKDKEKLKKIVEKAYLKNIIIVAANSNDGTVTYPSYFSNVIGVIRDKEKILIEEQFKYNLKSIYGIDLVANGIHSLDTFQKKIYKINNNCNSYAAPLITAEVLKLKNDVGRVPLSKLKEYLWKKSVNYDKCIGFYEGFSNLEWINNAIIFSINTKQYMILNYVFNVSKVVNIQNNNIYETFLCIYNYLLNSDLDEFDTIILDFNNIELDKNIILNKNLQAIFLFKKNIVFISSRVSNYCTFNLLKIHSRKVYLNKFYDNKALIKYKNDEPLIVLYGENEEEMYSMLLSLREKFRKDNFNAVMFSNSMKCIYYGGEFLPIEHLKNLKRAFYKLNGIMDIINGDIGLLGIYNLKKDVNYINILETYFDIDIYIFNDICSFEKFKNLLKENNKKVILSFNYKSNKENKGDLQLLYNDILSSCT